jgi:ABC-2 type transport system permease protein
MAKIPTPVTASTPEQNGESGRSRQPASTLRNIGLIFGREYKNLVKRRIFLVTSILYLAGIIIGAFVPTIIQDIEAHLSSQAHIVIINNAGPVANLSGAALTNYLATALNGQSSQSAGSTTTKAPFIVTMAAPADLKALQNEVKNGQLNALLVIDRTADQQVRFTYDTTASGLTSSDVAQVQTAANQLGILDKAASQHLSTSQINSLFAPPQFTITSLEQEQSTRSTADLATDIILSYLGVILIFTTIMLYGVSVAQGVAEEKGNRIIELLVLSTTPFQLMAGKIIGIGAAGLTQMAGLVAVGSIMLALQRPIHTAILGNTSGVLSINITSTSFTLLLLILVYFIVAFALYATLFAAAGSLVQRQDEAQSASTPITLLYVIGYIVSLSIVSIPSGPDALWFRIMSYIPFWTPTTMLVRMAVGTVAWWEIPMTVGLMILTALLCAWLSARIYRYGILSYGQRFRLSQLAKVIRG